MRTLTMLVEPEPPTLVALTNCGDPSMFVSAKVTEGLLAYDFDLNPRPQLATAWSVSPDSREFTFRLREGVQWHDGSPFTSRDVASAIALCATCTAAAAPPLPTSLRSARRPRTPRSSRCRSRRRFFFVCRQPHE